jgi:SAM-dependent methyltransferase
LYDTPRDFATGWTVDAGRLSCYREHHSMITSSQSPEQLKASVRAHWENEACGTRQLDTEVREAFFKQLEAERYEHEPYIPGFADFASARNTRVLEIGVGAGTDFVQWLRNGARATGIDLTSTGTRLTVERLSLEGFAPRVCQADAETLPFPDDTFDVVYSWGVLHHSPRTTAAVAEVRRVLRPGGEARIMIYHTWSIVAGLLWVVHGLLKLRPFQSPRAIVFQHLESPGTKTYTRQQARELFAAFSRVHVHTRLGSGDLLLMRPSAKYAGWATTAWRLYPRSLIRLIGHGLGLFLLIKAVK